VIRHRHSPLLVERLEDRALPSIATPLDLSSGLENDDVFGDGLFSSNHSRDGKHALLPPSNPTFGNSKEATNSASPIVGEVITTGTPTPVIQAGPHSSGQQLVPSAASQIPAYTPQKNDQVDQLIEQVLNQTNASGSGDYESFFKNLTGWIYQSEKANAVTLPSGVDLGDFYLLNLVGLCGDRDLLMQEVVQRLAKNDPSSHLDVRRVNLYGVPGEVGHTITEISVPTASGNQWEVFDSTFGTYFALAGQDTPLSMSAARQAFPNVEVMHVDLGTANPWSGVWATPSQPYSYSDLNVVFPSSQSPGVNNTYRDPTGTVWLPDIERTYFVSQAEDAGFAPYSYLRFSVDLSANPSGTIGSGDGSASDVASFVQGLSKNSIPAGSAAAIGAVGSRQQLTQFLFRSPSANPTAMQLTITTVEAQAQIFADLDQLEPNNADDGIAISTAGNSVTFSFDAYSSGTLVTLYVAWSNTVHFDQIQWNAPLNGSGSKQAIGVQLLNPGAGTVLGYPAFIDMASNGGAFNLPSASYAELFWIGSFNLTSDLGQNVVLPQQDVLLTPQLVFYTQQPENVVLSIPFSGSGSFTATVSVAMDGTGRLASYTLAASPVNTPGGQSEVFNLTLDHPFTTVTLHTSPSTSVVYPTAYEGTIAAQVAFSIDGTHQLWLLESGVIVNTGAFAMQVAASLDPHGNPDAYFTDGNNEVWRYDNGVVTNLGFFATRLAAGEGELAFTDGTNQVWLYSDATGNVIMTSTYATRLVGGADAFGSEFVLTDANNRIVTIDSRGNVKNTGGYGTRITESLDADGLLEVWFTDGNNEVWRFDQGKTMATNAFATQIAGSAGRLYFLDGNNQIWTMSDESSATSTGAFAKSITASTLTTTFFFLDQNNQIWILENGITSYGTSAYGIMISAI
jgi:hypothetical protein